MSLGASGLGTAALGAGGGADIATTADFTGSGALSVTTEAIHTTTADFTGSGVLSVVATVDIPETTAPFAGSGVLSVTVVPILETTAPFTGSGVLSVATFAVFTTTAPFAGSGVLTVATQTVILPAGDVSNRAYGIEIECSAVATWEPPVATRPAHLGAGLVQLTARAITAAVTVNAAGMPQVSETVKHKARYRLRVLVGNRDVTWVRDHATVLGSARLVKPLWYGSGSLTFPGTSYYEPFGTGDLKWLDKDKKVVLQLVDSFDDVVSTFFVGFVTAVTPTDDGHWSADLGGEATGRLSLVKIPNPKFRKNRDVLIRGANDLTTVGLRSTPRFPYSGIEVASRGGVDGLTHFNEHTALAVTNAGVQWTWEPDPLYASGVYSPVDVDRTTIHATCYPDANLTHLDVKTDLADDTNRSWATGVKKNGERIGNVAAPGVLQGTVPAFPGSMTIGATGAGYELLMWQLTFTGYLDLDDHGDTFDQAVADAVEELQEDAGLTVTGVVNSATWDALWDVTATQKGVNFIHERPFAQRSFTEKWKRSASGAIIGRNPNYRPHRTKVDADYDAGTGVTRRQLKRWSRNELAPLNTNTWTGTIRFESGLIVGEHNPGDPFTEADIMEAVDLRPGMNLWVPLFDGGTLFHVSGVEIAGDPAKGYTVTAIVDTKARDTMKAWEVHARNIESRHNPARAWSGRVRKSEIVQDSTTEWVDFCGKLTQDIALTSGWSPAIPIFSGQEGTIMRIHTELSPARESAILVTSKPISDARLAHLIPAPLADPGSGLPWYEQDAIRTFLESKGLVYAAGTFDEPCGYGYARHKDDAGNVTAAPLTGIHYDDGGWSYRTLAEPVLYLRKWVGNSTTLQRGQVFRQQLDSSGT